MSQNIGSDTEVVFLTALVKGGMDILESNELFKTGCNECFKKILDTLLLDWINGTKAKPMLHQS